MSLPESRKRPEAETSNESTQPQASSNLGNISAAVPSMVSSKNLAFRGSSESAKKPRHLFAVVDVTCPLYRVVNCGKHAT
jgi:hypothetical protein